MLIRIILCYLIIINFIAFAAYGIDKKKAVKGKWRIKESTLLILAAIGGAAGALLGMAVWRHKTKKAKFFITVPLLLILWIAAGIAVFVLTRTGRLF